VRYIIQVCDTNKTDHNYKTDITDRYLLEEQSEMVVREQTTLNELDVIFNKRTWA